MTCMMMHEDDDVNEKITTGYVINFSNLRRHFFIQSCHGICSISVLLFSLGVKNPCDLVLKIQDSRVRLLKALLL